MWPFGRVTGGVRLYDGFFRGMQNLNRIGDATAKVEGLKTALLESTIGIVDASLGYSLSVTFLDIGPRGSMSGNMQYAHLYFKVIVDIYLLASNINFYRYRYMLLIATYFFIFTVVYLDSLHFAFLKQ